MLISILITLLWSIFFRIFAIKLRNFRTTREFLYILRKFCGFIPKMRKNISSVCSEFSILWSMIMNHDNIIMFAYLYVSNFTSSLPVLGCFSSGSRVLSLLYLVALFSSIFFETILVGWSNKLSHRRKSYAIFEAMFLNPMLVPVVTQIN